MDAVGIERLALDHAAPHRLQHDLIEDLWINGALGEATTAILRQGRNAGYLLGQTEIQTPPVNDIGLNFAHGLTVSADAKQIANEQQLKEHHRIECRTAIVGIQVRGLVTNKSKVSRLGDLAQPVIRRYQSFRWDHL